MHDVIVIGGGIAGVSAAARLSRFGSVLLLEAEEALGHHASSRSAAVFEEAYGASEVVALNRASRAELEARGVLSARGLLLVATEEEEAAFAADRDGMGMEEVGLDRARGLWPLLGPGVTRAAWAPWTLDLDTDRLTQGFLREARAGGALVATKAPATGIARTPGGWRVETPRGAFEGARIVDAAGAWADRVAVMAGLPPLGLVPMRRSMARIPCPLDPSGWPMVVGAGESFYAKPDAGALLVSPAEEEEVEPHDAWAEEMALAEGLARFEAHAAVEVTRLLASWAGLRTFAPDRRLVIGPDPLEPAFLWCAGQGGYGFQTACAASRLLAELAAGEGPTLGGGLAAALGPGRFR